jgi:hypothetical protein
MIDRHIDRWIYDRDGGYLSPVDALSPPNDFKYSSSEVDG